MKSIHFCWITLVPALSAPAVELSELMSADAKAEKVAGDCKFTEGPAWCPKGFLLFSDIPNNRIVQLLPDGSTKDFLNPSENSNGLMFNTAGRLFACQGGGRRVVLVDLDAGNRIEVLADAFEGKPLNSPNDLALDASGGIYFTDPYYGPTKQLDQPAMGVYYIDAARRVTRVISDLERPNGILVSPDGKFLHVAEPNKRELYRYQIDGPGKISGKKLVFTGDKDQDGGGPDGMAHDASGNIYATYNGIVVLDAEGKLVGRIPVPEHPANCKFGGKDMKTLYITARTSLYAIGMKASGAPLQAGAGAAPAAPAAAGEGGKKTVKAGALSLQVPASWKEIKSESRMRLAQFEVPAAKGDELAGEYVVFYFGAGGAGSVQANIERWIGQFETEGRKTRVLQGKCAAGDYTVAEVTGTYNMPIGPPIERKTKALPSARLLAAIVQTGEGAYFIKFAGPEKTITAAADDFRATFGGKAAEEKEAK